MTGIRPVIRPANSPNTRPNRVPQVTADTSREPPTGARRGAGGTQEAPEHPTGQPSDATHDAVVRLRVPCQEADLLGAHVAVALRRRKDFDIARSFRHEVVDGVFVVRDVIETTYGGKYGNWGDFQYKKREFSIQDIILYHVMHYVSSNIDIMCRRRHDISCR